MSVTKKDVLKIANLARLHVNDEEIAKYTEQMNLILEYMEQLNQINTADVEPLSHPLDLKNIFREDKVQPSLPVEDALRNAPDKSGNYFKVPKVINK